MEDKDILWQRMNDLIDIMHHQCDVFHAHGGSSNVEDFDIEVGVFSISLVPYGSEIKNLIKETEDFIKDDRKLSNGGKTGDFKVKKITEEKIFIIYNKSLDASS